MKRGDIKYRLSKRFQAIKYKDIYFCFNSLLGRYGIIDYNTYKFFQLFKNKEVTKEKLNSVIKQKNIDEFLDEYIKYGFIIRNNEDEQKRITLKKKRRELNLRNNQIYFLGFNITDTCNFKCTYCIKRECDSLWGLKRKHSLDWKKIKEILDQFFKIVLTNKRKIITVGFSGGEPLLNFATIRTIVKYVRKNLIPAKKVNFVITTNGVLINHKIARFLSKNKFFRIGISLDGDKKANNRVRKYLDNKRETYDDIIKGVKILLNYVDADKITISTTISGGNFELLNNTFLDFVKDMGIKKLSLEPNLINLINRDYNKIVKKIFKLCKYGDSIGLTVDGYWKKPFSSLLRNRWSPIGSCYSVRGESIAVTTEGKIKPCIYSKEMYSGNKLIEINTLPAYKSFLISMWVGNIKECRGCPIEGVCLGGCYLSRIMPNKEVFKYRCFLYKKLTRLLIIDFLKKNYNEIKNSL